MQRSNSRFLHSCFTLTVSLHSPLLLLCHFLFTCLGLHLLNVNSVWFAATHIQFMITHAQSQNAFVDANTWCKEYKIRCFFIDGLNDEFSIIKRNVADF